MFADAAPLPAMLAVGLILNLIVTLAEVFAAHGNEDAVRARRILTQGALAGEFWGWSVSGGLLLPLVLIALWPEALFPSTASAVLALSGIWIFDDVWIKAGQAIPLS
jgi:hypothetical protein